MKNKNIVKIITDGATLNSQALYVEEIHNTYADHYEESDILNADNAYEEAKRISNDPKESNELFLKIIQKTSNNIRITNTVEKFYLGALMSQMFDKDDDKMFDMFLGARIQPEDGGYDNYLRRFLVGSNTRCLQLYMDSNPDLNVNQYIFTTLTDTTSLTALQAAVRFSDTKTIDLMLQHATNEHTEHLKQGIIACALKNTHSGVVEHLIHKGFSPYTKDNKIDDIGYRDEIQKKFYSIIFASFYQRNFKKPMYKTLIENMNDLEQLKEEKTNLQAVIPIRFGSRQGRDEEALHLLDEKIKILSETKTLSSTIQKVREVYTNGTLDPLNTQSREIEQKSKPNKI